MLSNNKYNVKIFIIFREILVLSFFQINKNFKRCVYNNKHFFQLLNIF